MKSETCHLFIDTNILLSFYRISKDDLEQLKKIGVLLEQKKIVLYYPEQVTHEYRRNRDKVISDELRLIQESKITRNFPRVCDGYEELKELLSLSQTYETKKKELLDKLREDALSQKLRADKVIQAIYFSSKTIVTNKEIINKAKQRYDLGNPPGKDKSYGDGVVWESLLSSVPEGEDLYFISNDTDYCSHIDRQLFSPYLSSEWSIEKSANIHWFDNLSSFFNGRFPEIKLANEFSKELLISDLQSSSNFAETRRILRLLNKYRVFSRSQVEKVVRAAVENTQVRWIFSEDEVRSILVKITEGSGHWLPPELSEAYLELFIELSAN